MANRFPLIVNTTSGNSVQELPSGDFLDLSNSGISNSGNISVSGIISATGALIGASLQTSNTISANTTYSAGLNTLLVSPITINTGVVVTVSAGAVVNIIP